MIIKVYFEKTNNTIPFDNQHRMNGFVYGMLGDKASKYHDTFSPYSVSSIQGGHANQQRTGIVFDDEPFIQITTDNMDVCADFINAINNAIDTKSSDFYGLKPVRWTCTDFDCKPYFDVVKTISPILLKKEGRKLNCRDNNWLEELNENCRKKLHHAGIDDPSFRIELKVKDKVRTKMIMVGDVFNPCTECVCTVFGTKEARKKIYNLGFGNSTGSGFGAVKILNKECAF